MSSTVTVSISVSVEYSPPEEVLIRMALSSSVSSSWSADTVTVWGVRQLAAVKVRASLVRLAPLRVRSVPVMPVTVTVTVSVGSVSNVTA